MRCVKLQRKGSALKSIEKYSQRSAGTLRLQRLAPFSGKITSKTLKADPFRGDAEIHPYS
jgi:hypothetical protein